MVTVSQIQNGAAKYIDDEVLVSMPGWQRWVFGAGAGIAINNFPQIVEKWKNEEIVKMLGVIDKEGNVDINKIYQGVKRQAAKGPISFDIPGMGKMTLNESDVDKIYKYITSQTTGGM